MTDDETNCMRYLAKKTMGLNPAERGLVERLARSDMPAASAVAVEKAVPDERRLSVFLPTSLTSPAHVSGVYSTLTLGAGDSTRPSPFLTVVLHVSSSTRKVKPLTTLSGSQGAPVRMSRRQLARCLLSPMP